MEQYLSVLRRFKNLLLLHNRVGFHVSAYIQGVSVLFELLCSADGSI